VKFAHFSHVWGKQGMSPTERYEQLWRELALCDELGFDYGFCVEHHFRPHESWMSDPNVYCAAAAARTKRIRLGAMGHIVPLHHPLRLAEELAMVDQVIGGRLEIGLVSGVTPLPFPPFGRNFAERREITTEFVRFLKSVYAENGGFDFEGQYHSFDYGLRLGVTPAQKPCPPIWLETRDPATLQFCAELGLNTGYFMLFARETVAPRYKLFLDQWKKAGHARKPNIAYSCAVFVDETDEAAMKNGLEHASRAYRGLFRPSPDPEEVRRQQMESADRYDRAGDHAAAEIVRHVLDADYQLEHDLVLVGSPETVTAKLKKIATSGVFNTFLGEFNFGELPEKELMRSIRLFGEHVMPKLRGFEPF
jgi:alkanesulfonate monooxygenase SsuD/methylene tetrahydromethanopterin reductase-like flavin-dependent oxidoreductase (luciferase family)